jgi:hypothetical protein
MVFDPTKMDHPPMPNYDWVAFYRDDKEIIPPNAPEPRCNSVQTTCFADSDHAGDLTSQKSRTGVLVFANRAPIIFYSKKQGSIETSSLDLSFLH